MAMSTKSESKLSDQAKKEKIGASNGNSEEVARDGPSKRKLPVGQAGAAGRPTSPEVEESVSKKAKVEASEPTLDDGDDLVPLSSTGLNVFYCYSNGISKLFKNGDEDAEGLYWSKRMIADAHQQLIAKEALDEEDEDRVLAANEDKDGIYVCYASITCPEENLKTKEAKELGAHYSSLSGWWYEVTLTREEPTDTKRLKVALESSHFWDESYVEGGKKLGEWWMSDVKLAEGESHEIIDAMYNEMFQS